jgi:hypothetical protein
MLVGDQEVTRKISNIDAPAATDENNVVAGDEQPNANEPYHYPWEDEKPKKKGWWFFALIVAALALGVIFFRVYKSGFVTSAAGNHQPINAAP